MVLYTQEEIDEMFTEGLIDALDRVEEKCIRLEHKIIKLQVKISDMEVKHENIPTMQQNLKEMMKLVEELKIVEDNHTKLYEELKYRQNMEAAY